MINVVIFFTIYISGFVGSLVSNPAIAFCLYEAVYFINPERRWWYYMVPTISYSYFVVAFLLLLVIKNYKLVVSNKLLQVPQIRWMYAVLVLYMSAYFYAVFPQEHYIFSIYFLKLVIIVSAAYKLCKSKDELNYYLYGYIFGAWYIGFVAFQTGRNSGVRLEGIGTVDASDSNDIAAAIAPAIVLCLYYFWTCKKWWAKGLFAIAGVFVADGIILINSRGSFLGIIASLAYFMFYMYFSAFQRKNQKLTAVFITVVGLAGVASLIDPSSIRRFESMSNTEIHESHETGATRMIFWEGAWEMAKDHPFGAGFHGFNYFAPEYIPSDINTGASKNRAVHSSWFETLSEVGYPGLLAFIMMIYFSFRTLESCKKQLRQTNLVDEYFKVIAIQSALLSFVVSMTFINRMRAEILYWLIMLTACAYNIYVLKMRDNNPSSEIVSDNSNENWFGKWRNDRGNYRVLK